MCRPDELKLTFNGTDFTLGALDYFCEAGGGARPTKITAPSPPGLQQTSISKSGFQLLSAQMLPPDRSRHSLDASVGRSWAERPHCTRTMGLRCAATPGCQRRAPCNRSAAKLDRPTFCREAEPQG